jgi:hypothetical protein
MMRVILLALLMWGFAIVVIGCASVGDGEIAKYRAEVEEWLKLNEGVVVDLPPLLEEPEPELVDLSDMVVVRGNGKPHEEPMSWPIGGVITNVHLSGGRLNWYNVSGIETWPVQEDTDGDPLGGVIYVLVPLGGNRWELNFTEFIRPNGQSNGIHLERCKTRPKSGDVIKVGLTTMGSWVFPRVEKRLRTSSHDVVVP